MHLIEGEFYKKLKDQSNYADDTEICIKNTVSKLMDFTTSTNRPGMLLGKIQSGKTRAFISVSNKENCCSFCEKSDQVQRVEGYIIGGRI